MTEGNAKRIQKLNITDILLELNVISRNVFFMSHFFSYVSVIFILKYIFISTDVLDSTTLIHSVFLSICNIQILLT